MRSSRIVAVIAGWGAAVSWTQPLDTWALENEKWLAAQATPNRRVPDPDPSRRRLLVSYDVPREKSPAGFHRSATYDDALAAITFTMVGKMEAASIDAWRARPAHAVRWQPLV